jgi:exonuclease SbcD
MRFVQASDFHLDPAVPERLDALTQVVRLARSEGADALLLPGDVFDAPQLSDPLRAAVRAALEEFGGTTIVVPGNHDLDGRDPARTAFPPGADFGRRTVVLASTPFAVHDLDDRSGGSVRVVGVPYRVGRTLGRDLAGLEFDPLRTVLLAHGTLVTARHDSPEKLEGQEAAYYPIREDDLRGRFGYAALGHLHARATFDDWTATAAWGYAGSAVAINRGEIGRRHAVRVDLDPGVGVREVRRIALATPYWSECRETALPWDDVESIVSRVAAQITGLAAESDVWNGLRIRVDGHLDGAETDLRRKIEEIAAAAEGRFRCIEVDVAQATTVQDLVRAHAWLAELLERLRRRSAADRAASPAAVRIAAGLLVAAARIGPR